jgi:presenilin-like A22 family membrane protease
MLFSATLPVLVMVTGSEIVPPVMSSSSISIGTSVIVAFDSTPATIGHECLVWFVLLLFCFEGRSLT